MGLELLRSLKCRTISFKLIPHNLYHTLYSKTQLSISLSRIYEMPLFIRYKSKDCSGGKGKGQTITCKAAVAWEPNKLCVEDIQVEAPKKREVRVKIIATGVCHTDSITMSGRDKEALFPAILGHEAAGIVESIGEGVTKFKPGDHVIPLFIPQCNECKLCKSGKTNICAKVHDVPSGIAPTRGTMWDDTTRFKCKGKDIYHYMGTSTFSQYTVVDDIGLAKVDPKAPLDKICLLGCGVSTGYGAPIKTANMECGATCAVWGLGGVGLACVMGCVFQGAKQIIGIDINPEKEALAKKFGITEFINPKDLSCPIQEFLIKQTDGGLDYTYESAGTVQAMREAFESTHVGWGKSVIIGVASSGVEVCTLPLHMIVGRSWMGSPFGGWKLDEVPGLVDRYMKKGMMLDEFVTQTMCLNDINDAFKFMHEGKGLRSVVYMDHKD